MLKINSNYKNLKESYLFAGIAKKVAAYQAQNPDKKVIKMGIGDVTLPLCSAVIKGLHKGVDEQSAAETFKGYGPEQGHNFLQAAIKDYYASYGVCLEAEEIFISDGAKSDVGNILDIFDRDNIVLVPDPVYPVYVDTNTMDGRKIIYMNANEQNGFLPLPDKSVKADDVVASAKNADKRYIADVRVFDVYEGENLSESKKSIALSITFQPVEATFSDKDLEILMSKVEQAVKTKCNAQLRDA